MGSTRLPGKVLMKIEGKPLLEIMLKRVKKSKLIDKIIIATSDQYKDDKIVDYCKVRKYNFFRGSENDVLLRYFDCAKKYNGDVIVRLTADCPLIDPGIIDKVIKLYFDSNVDYAANTVPPETNRYPDGSDVEVFSFKGIEGLVGKASDLNDVDREHVTFPFWKRNFEYKTIQLPNKYDWGKFRITVDYPEDYELMKIIFEAGKEFEYMPLESIIEYLDNNPQFAILNQSLSQQNPENIDTRLRLEH